MLKSAGQKARRRAILDKLFGFPKVPQSEVAERVGIQPSELSRMLNSQRPILDAEYSSIIQAIDAIRIAKLNERSGK